jgi:hypothetical protein
VKKAVLILAAVIVCLSFSCKRGDKTKIRIEKSTAEKIELPEKVKVVIDLKHIREGIIAYQSVHDTFPGSLDALGLDLNYPDAYDYDTQKGVVNSIDYPDL